MSAPADAWSSVEVRFGRCPGKAGPQILDKGFGGQVELTALAGDHVEFRGIGENIRPKRPHFAALDPAFGIMRGRNPPKRRKESVLPPPPWKTPLPGAARRKRWSNFDR